MKSNLLKVAALSVLLIGLGSCGNDPKPTTSSEGTASTPAAQTSSVAASVNSSTGETTSSTTEEEEPKTLADLYDKSVEFSELEDGNITETKAFNTDFSAPLKANDTHYMAVETVEEAVTIEELTFTKRIKTGGSSNVGTPYRVFEFTLTAQATIDLYMKSGSSAADGRTVYLQNVTKGWQEDSKVVPLDPSKVALTAYYGDTYRIGFSNNCHVYGIGVTLGEGEGTFVPEQPQLASDNYLNANELLALTMETSLTRGNFTINAGSKATPAVDPSAQPEDHSVVIETVSNKTIEGTTYSKRIKTGGAGKLTYRSISFTVTAGATVFFDIVSSSSSVSRIGHIVDSTDQLVGDPITVETNAAQYMRVFATAGTYTIYGTDGGINIYGIKIVPAAA